MTDTAETIDTCMSLTIKQAKCRDLVVIPVYGNS